MVVGGEHRGSAAAARVRPVPDEAVSFAADVLLIAAFVFSLGVPLYYVIGLVTSVQMIALYVASALFVSCSTPVVAWWLRWGWPGRNVAAFVAFLAFVYVVPTIGVAAVIVALGFEMALVGVGIMAYIAGIVTMVASQRFGSAPGHRRMVVVRLVCAIGTPLVVLGFAGWLPHGVNVIGGWSMPMLAAVAGAVGGARGLQRSLVSRATP